jgi:hypothetical protein
MISGLPSRGSGLVKTTGTRVGRFARSTLSSHSSSHLDLGFAHASAWRFPM